MNDADIGQLLAELFAPIGASELDVARCREFLSRAGWQGLDALGDVETIRTQLSLSRAPAMKLASAVALQRIGMQQMVAKGNTLEDIADVVRKADHELLYGLYWGVRKELLHTELLAVGDLTSVSLQPYAALRPAFLAGTKEFDLLHNHPSGALEPSLVDLTSVKRLKRSAAELGIELNGVYVVSMEGIQHNAV